MPASDLPAARMTWKGRLLRRLVRWKARTPSEMARYAARHTEFYRRFYAGKDVDDFASLPVLRKSVVRDVSPYEFLSDAHAKDVVWYGETTGSSGSPTPSFLTRKEFHGATLLAHLSPGYPALVAAIRENRTCVNGLAFGFTIAAMHAFYYFLRAAFLLEMERTSERKRVLGTSEVTS